MIFLCNQRIHPNIPKHIAEFLGEDLLPKDVLESLRNVNFYKEKNGMSALQDFLKDSVNPSVLNSLLIKVNNYIYESRDPLNIILDYINSAPVRRNIKSSLAKFNNNRNYTFDLEAILADFRTFCSGSVISGYSLDSNGLAGYLTNAYDGMYAQSPKGTEFITGILNDRGSLIETEDGAVMLEELATIKDEKKVIEIDFPKIVKNIYNASQVLFDISGQVRYNIFSYFLSEDLDNLETKLSEMLDAFFSTKYSPDLLVLKKNYGFSDYRVDTIEFRLSLFSSIVAACEHGLTSKTMKDLFDTIKKRDADNKNSNVGKLFIHTDTQGESQSNKKPNEQKFLEILRGIQSAKELQTYLHATNQKLYEEDCELLFETPYYYKRFLSIDDYFLLRDVTPDLIEKSKDFTYLSDSVGYDTNDSSFNSVMNMYNLSFSTLRDYMKLNLRKENSFNVKDTLVELINLRNILKPYDRSARQSYNNVMNHPVRNITDPDMFDSFRLGITNGPKIYDEIIFANSKLEKQDLMDLKDVRIVLRFCNFYTILLDHFIHLLNQSTKDMDSALLTMDLSDLFLPDVVDTLKSEDLVRFISDVPMNFFLSEDENVTDIAIRKQYSLIYLDFLQRLGGAVDYLKGWSNKVEEAANDISLRFKNLKVSAKLKLISLQIMRMEDKSNASLSVFASSKQIVDGFIFVNGSIYRNNYGYVHIRGYFYNPDMNDISPIPRGAKL